MINSIVMMYSLDNINNYENIYAILLRYVVILKNAMIRLFFKRQSPTVTNEPLLITLF